jgi:hypothetical protein
MKRKLFALAVTLLAMLGFVAARHRFTASTISTRPQTPTRNPAAANNEILAAYGKLPLSFEINQGQTNPRVKFLAQGTGYTVFLAGDEATLLLDPRPGVHLPLASAPASNAKPTMGVSAAIRLGLTGSNLHAEVESLDLQPGSSNYLIGNDRSRWRRNIPHFARVKYRAVYPGVDLIYYGNQGQLESDYIVAPGASPRQIGVHIEGADRLKLDSRGDLIVSTKVGDLLLHKPRAYQQKVGRQQEIAANYIQRGAQTVGIEVASYDASQPLIIDPVLGYSTYLGGTANQQLNGIAADATGFAYVTGATTSANFPITAGSLQTTKSNPSSNAFITKLKQDGSGLVYSTFLGGTGASGDGATSIAVDASGDAYIVGTTSSTDFPITPGSAFQTTNKGANGFFTELAPTGSSLLYSTYLGGTGSDGPAAIALDTNGNAYIGGSTTSTDFPLTSSAVQNTNNVTTSTTGFLARIDPTKSGTQSLIYSTYLGGSTHDVVLGVAVDSTFNAYLIGYTASTDFPLKNAFQTTLKNPSSNAFVARIDTTQTADLVYSTYLGSTPDNMGSSPGDIGTAIAVPPTGGIAYVTGYTYSPDFPLVAPLDSNSNTPGQKAFISRVDTTKSGVASLPFSTYFGGTVVTLNNPSHGADLAFAIALDSVGNAYVAGTTSSADFPVTPGAPQPNKVAIQNAFLSELSPTGSSVLFSTYLGASIDAARGVALDGATPPNAYITGITATAFPTTVGAFQTTNNVSGANNQDGFVAKISPGAVTGVFASPVFLAFGNQIVNTPSSAKTITLFNDSSTALTAIAISFTGTNASDFSQGTSTCTTVLAASSSCTIGVIFKPSTTSSESAALSITDSDASSPQTVSLTGTGTAAPAAVFLAPATVAFGNQLINTTSAAQIVTLTNNSSATVTGIAVTLAGTSSASFAQTSTCTASLPATGTCTISVTFTPTVAAAATATLSVADSDASSPQTAALTGTGITSNPDFSLAVSPAMTSIAAGSTAAITVTVAGLNGFTTPVALTCAGAPIDSSCMLVPASVTPTATGAASTASIVTAVRTMATWVAPPTGSLRSGPRHPSAIWPVTFALFLFAVWIVRRQPTAKKLAWAYAVLLALSLTSCSGLPNTGTPAGIYTITITGTSGTLTHQVTVSLTVT